MSEIEPLWRHGPYTASSPCKPFHFISGNTLRKDRINCNPLVSNSETGLLARATSRLGVAALPVADSPAAPHSSELSNGR